MAITTGKHPILSKLKTPNHMDFDRTGQWFARGATRLSELSEDLDVEKVGIDINSIPDMWARPLLFEMAFYDDQHLLHERVHGEWRGLLAMLALKEFARLAGLTAQEVSIPRVDPDAPPPARGAAPDFLRSLAQLAPAKTLDTATSWHNLYLFLYNGRPIGMTCPTTLAVTATEYFGLIERSAVPWFDGRLLTDPTGAVHRRAHPNEQFPSNLSAQQRGALSKWLGELEARLRKRQTFQPSLPEANALLGLIRGYAADVGAAGDYKLLESSFGMTKGVFKLLDAPVEPGESEESDVLLVSSRRKEAEEAEEAERAAAAAAGDSQGDGAGSKSPARFKPTPILVVDEKIAEQWVLEKRDVLVWNTTTLQSIPYGGLPPKPPADKHNLPGGGRVENVEVWSPHWFFKDALYVVGMENAFPNAPGAKAGGLSFMNQQVTPILPLDKELVRQLTVKDLEGRISFEQRGGDIVVRLRLPLSRKGDDDKPLNFEVTRLYRSSQNEIRFLEDVPVLAVWPNFRATELGWKANYTYFDATGVGETFDAKPFVPGFEKAPALEDKALSTGADVTRRVTRTDSYPEAMICYARPSGEDLGLILVRQPEQKEPWGVPFKVGIDFGATGTNIYYKKGTDSPKPFAFADRYVFVTAVSSERQEEIYDNSLPSDAEQTPFLSIFKTFPNPPGQNLRPLLDGVIFFPRVGEQFKDDITYNLKWSGKKGDAHKAEAFLKQLTLQVAAEAVNGGASHVGWTYSFPSAFSNTRRTAFHQTWASVINSCQKLTGVRHSADAPPPKTESVAAALYFRDPNGYNASTAMGAVCVDIGGSTSDIAIWQSEELLWQTSLRLAGRDIFLDFLLKNPDVLTVLEQGFNTRPLVEARDRGPIAFYAQADALLRQKGEELLGSLRLSAEESEVKKLNRVLALGISGIFYYVGLVVQRLVQEKKYRKETPKFYIGGNGSRMLRWLNLGGQFDSGAQINQLFRVAFARASGLQTDTLTTETSRQPKSEAAYGLICDATLGDKAGNGDKVVAGEKFILAGKEEPWSTLIDEESFTRGIEAPSSLDRIADFLVAFNEGAKAAELPLVAPKEADRNRLLQEVRGDLGNSLNDARQKGGDDGIQVEPVFILALKSLLRIASSGKV